VFSSALSEWTASSFMNMKTPGDISMSLPSSLKMPFPSITWTKPCFVEVCLSICVPAAMQKRVVSCFSFERVLLMIPSCGYSIICFMFFIFVLLF